VQTASRRVALDKAPVAVASPKIRWDGQLLRRPKAVRL
jgi:hypothetical protein